MLRLLHIRNKEAVYSSQVESTRAKLTDALQAEVERTPDLPKDVDDILRYIKAMNEGLKRLDKLPLSLRLIKEVHATLLTKAGSSTHLHPANLENRKIGLWEQTQRMPVLFLLRRNVLWPQ